VVVGDDTWSEGTQVPADSRFLSQHLYMPVMEPATFQEIKDWVGVGFELSSASRLFITYLVTSNQADGGGSVTVSPNRFPRLSARRRTRIDTSAISSDDRVIIPPVTTVKESQVVEERHPRLVAAARERGINAILNPLAGGARSDLAFVTSGLAYVYLEHALHILGLTGRFPILKLGISSSHRSQQLSCACARRATAAILDCGASTFQTGSSAFPRPRDYPPPSLFNTWEGC